MATKEKTLDKPVETSSLPEQQVDGIAKDSPSKGNVFAAASQDAVDILSILDNIATYLPAAEQRPPKTSLTAEENDKLTNLLGEAKPKIKVESNEQGLASEKLSPPELADKKTEDATTTHDSPINNAEDNGEQAKNLLAESIIASEDHGNSDKLTAVLDAIQNKPSDQRIAPESTETEVKLRAEKPVPQDQMQQAKIFFDEQEQTNLNDLLINAQSQLEKVTAECNLITEELVLAKARIKELEDHEHKNKTRLQDQACMKKEIAHLNSGLTEMAEANENLIAQVQKQLELLAEAETNKEALEADLSRTHETAFNLQNEVQTLQGKLKDYDNMVTELRIQLVDQTTRLRTRIVEQTEKMTKIQEKFQYEITQRRKAERMLREIKSRLVVLTQVKSTPTNQIISKLIT